MTPQVRQQIMERLALKMSPKSIAAIYGEKVSTIEFLRDAFEALKDVRVTGSVPIPQPRPPGVVRNRLPPEPRVQKPPHQDQPWKREAYFMRKAGKTFQEIGLAIGKNPSTVH